MTTPPSPRADSHRNCTKNDNPLTLLAPPLRSRASQLTTEHLS